MLLDFIQGLLIIVVPAILLILLIYFSSSLLFRPKMKYNYILIKDYNSFSKYSKDLKKAKKIGVDTEHFQDNSYKGILCLIQLHISEYNVAFIIDLIELNKKKDDKGRIYSELKNIFENKNIEKIFHSCYNDLRWISETINTNFNNIFDTQYIDNYINKKRNKNISHNKNLNNLLKKYLDLNFSEEDKRKLQKSDWLSRPLSKKQLNYAANDALYLIQLREKMYKIINNEQNFKKIQKEFNIEIKNKLVFKNNKKEEKFKDIAELFINENMTVVNENEYIRLSKEIFSNLMKKTDDFASKNNINPEKLLSLNSIFHICNKLPKNKEKIIKIINHQQNTNINIEDLNTEIIENNILSEEKELNNKIKKFYIEIIDFILIKAKELEKSFANLNIESSKSKNILEGKKTELLRNLKKEASKKTVVNSSICKGPIYDSCKMLAPDGQQLCFCDFKKMTWYLERNLAELISKDPPVFKLIFEPNARGCVDENMKSSNFYIESRTNCCVICGNTKNYLRFHVIPILYRSCFPENLKSHKSHDVVLLCLECHERARKVYEKKKEEISKRYGVPLNVMSDEKNNYLKLKQFQKKCKIFIKNKKKSLPENAKDKLKNNIREMYNFLLNNSEFFNNFVEKNGIKCEKNEDINGNFLELFSEQFKIDEINIPEGKKNLHGKLVIEKVKDLKEFIMEWRKFFIDSFEPKFLPKEWSVEHEIVRTFGEHSNFRNEKNYVDNKSIVK